MKHAPSRCRIVQDSGGWHCVSAGCGAAGTYQAGWLVDRATGKSIRYAEATPDHPIMLGELCLFDRAADSEDAGVGDCGGCAGTLALLRNPYGAVARCVPCRARDDVIARIVRLLIEQGVPESATAPIMRWLAQPFNWEPKSTR